MIPTIALEVVVDLFHISPWPLSLLTIANMHVDKDIQLSTVKWVRRKSWKLHLQSRRGVVSVAICNMLSARSSPGWPSSSSFTLINYAPRALLFLSSFRPTRLFSSVFFVFLASFIHCVLLLRYHDWIISCSFSLSFLHLLHDDQLISLSHRTWHATIFSMLQDAISSRFFACCVSCVFFSVFLSAK